MKKILICLTLVLTLFVSCNSLKDSDLLSIELDENPTTGYRWEFVTDDNVLELVFDEFTANLNKGLLGAGGTRILTFKPLADKDTVLYLYYVRPWEVFIPEEPDLIYHYNSKTHSLEKLI